MWKTVLPAAMAAVLAMSLPATAQQATKTEPRKISVIGSQTAQHWLSSRFKGMDVLGVNDERIGDIIDILFDKNGRIEAYVVGLGGFLGIGAKDVAFTPASFEIIEGDKSKNKPDKLKLGAHKDWLRAQTNFKRCQSAGGNKC